VTPDRTIRWLQRVKNGVRTYPWGSDEVALPREALYVLMAP
jgi:hypothetical protein